MVVYNWTLDVVAIDAQVASSPRQYVRYSAISASGYEAGFNAATEDIAQICSASRLR